MTHGGGFGTGKVESRLSPSELEGWKDYLELMRIRGMAVTESIMSADSSLCEEVAKGNLPVRKVGKFTVVYSNTQGGT